MMVLNGWNYKSRKILFFIILFLSIIYLVGAQEVKLEFGATKSASLTIGGEIDSYYFDANAGDSVHIQASTATKFYPQVELFAPTGERINLSKNIWWSNEINAKLPVTGRYVVLVSSYPSGGTGPYTVFVVRTSVGTITPSSPTPTQSLPTATQTTMLPEKSPTISGITTANQSPLTIPLPYLGLVVVGVILAAFIIMKYTRDTKSKSHSPLSSIKSSGAQPIESLPTVDHDTFISYASEDKPTADAICNTLESRRIRCWIAPRDILPGMKYQESIIDAIDRSAIMVLVFSTHSNTSPHVLSEVTEAMSKEVIIIPFRIEDVLPSKAMKYLISVPHWLDAMTPPLEKHIEELVKTIQVILNQKKGGNISQK